MNLKFIAEIEENLNNLKLEDKNSSSIINSFIKTYRSLNSDFLSLQKNLDDLKETNVKKINELISNRDNNNLNLKSNLEKELKRLEAIEEEYKTNYQNNTLKANSLMKEKIEEINLKIKDLKKSWDVKKNNLSIELNKQINEINKKIINIKKNINHDILKIEDNYNLTIEKLNDEFKENEISINNRILELETRINDNKTFYDSKIENYRNESDKKYLEIKNIYQEKSRNFNKVVNKINDQKIKKKEEYNKALKENLIPYEKYKVTFKENHEHAVHKLTNEQKVNVDNLLIKLDNNINNYNQVSETIIYETNEEITLYNSKLSSLKESLLKDREEKLEKLKTDVYHAKNYFEEQTLKKQFRSFVKGQDNELKKQNDNTNLIINDVIKKRYEKLKKAEDNYLRNRFEIRLQIQQLELQLEKEINIQETYLNHLLKEVQLKEQRLALTNQFKLGTLDNEVHKKIAPLENELAIANSLSERDINILSNETKVNLNNYLFEIDSYNYKQQIRILKAKRESMLNTLKYEYDLSSLNINKQLLIEKENIRLEESLIKQELNSSYAKITYEINKANEDLNFLIKTDNLEKELDYLKKSNSLLINYYDNKYKIDENTSLLNKLYFNNVFHNDNNLKEIILNKDILLSDSTYFIKQINYLFNYIKVITSPLSEFKETLLSLYNLPATPTLINGFINSFNASLEYHMQSISNLTNSFLEDLLNHYNDLIKIIIKSKYDIIKFNNEASLNVELGKIENSKLLLKDENTKHNYDINKLGKKIDKLNNDISHLEILMMDESNKDDLDSNKNKVKSLNKEIELINTDIANLRKKIALNVKAAKSLSISQENINKKYNRKLEEIIKKENRNLKFNYKKFNFVSVHINYINKIILDLKQKLMSINHKLSEPLYLTDVITKDFEKNHNKIFKQFNNNLSLTKDKMINETNQLFNSLINSHLNRIKILTKNKDILTNDFNKKIKENEANNTLNNAKLQNDLKKSEQAKKELVKNSKLLIKKESSENINKLIITRKEIEKKILDSDQKLKDELLLVDDNLKDVNNNYTEDYEKKSIRTNRNYRNNIQKTSKLIRLRRRVKKQLIEAVNLKNVALENRFEDVKKQLELNLKNKLIELNNDLIKINDEHNKRLSNFNLLITNNTNEYYENKEKLNKKYHQLSLNIKKEETSILKKQLKDLEKSNRYKQKTLNLS